MDGMQLVDEQLGVGVSLKPQHFEEILSTLPAVGWFEIHSENYMGRGGPSLAYLETVRAKYPISMHGVSLSLGSDEALNRDHLKRLKALVDRIEPVFISEHLSWSRLGQTYLNDLIALPYNKQSLEIMCAHVQETQEFLGRTIMVENPSAYVAFKESTMEEPEFLIELTRKSGCKLLIDVNNIYVSGNNNHFDPKDYIAVIPEDIVGEIHLAGHCRKKLGADLFCIDDHGSKVSTEVWELFKLAVTKLGPVSTLIEWDTDVTSLQTLLLEAQLAEKVINDYKELKHAAAS